MALSSARKAAMAAVAVAALGGVSFFGASASEAAPGPAGHASSTPAPAPASTVVERSVSARRQAPQVVTRVIGKGRVDGHRWSVALEFHRTLPKGYTLPTLPDGASAPGTSLLCQRMYIGGVRVDHQGGPWSDCQPVTGTNDPAPAGEMGLWGLHDKGLDGTRLMVANPEPDVAYGLITLTNGHQIKAETVTVPGTTYRAWAAPIPDGRTIAAVDQYDSRHHQLTHDTNWH
ncbi:hypothetical protein ACFYMX_33530 [Streptomyces griseofuscus]|uniref:hypothetical protein n=1 Tax=Streptomyces griseofuscus TaxID=146922 RepID=UPI0036A1AF4F